MGGGAARSRTRGDAGAAGAGRGAGTARGGGGCGRAQRDNGNDGSYEQSDPQNDLFRRPAGLAVGLALKEPAPPVDSPRDSPRELGSPAPRRTSRGLGVLYVVSLLRHDPVWT